MKTILAWIILLSIVGYVAVSVEPYKAPKLEHGAIPMSFTMWHTSPNIVIASEDDMCTVTMDGVTITLPDCNNVIYRPPLESVTEPHIYNCTVDEDYLYCDGKPSFVWICETVSGEWGTYDKDGNWIPDPAYSE